MQRTHPAGPPPTFRSVMVFGWLRVTVLYFTVLYSTVLYRCRSKQIFVTVPRKFVRRCDGAPKICWGGDAPKFSSRRRCALAARACSFLTPRFYAIRRPLSPRHRLQARPLPSMRWSWWVSLPKAAARIEASRSTQRPELQTAVGTRRVESGSWCIGVD